MPNSLTLVREGVELDRHYAFLYCSPSRSSLQSGRFPHHVNQVNLPEAFETAGINRKMTTIPRKLKQAGYATHMTGKWHIGAATPDHTPKGRGYDTSLGYFAGAEDHKTQRQCIDPLCAQPDDDSRNFVDLWQDDGPAYGKNGTYGDKMFGEFAMETLKKHPLETPIFFYIALQNNHMPLQAPQAYLDRFPADWNPDRRAYAAMGAYWDEVLGNITGVLKDRGMWEDTLLVLTSDNGGPVYPSLTPGYRHCGGANNWPLFGGKASNWEGGVRVSSFIAGGFVPEAVRGTKQEGNVHIADWYATFCGLAGVDPADDVPGLPPVDSVDVWPLLSGAQATSPRYELPLSVDAKFGISGGAGMGNVSALILGDYKLLTGRYLTSIRQAQEWPNNQTCCRPLCWVSQVVECGSTEKPKCLFNIREDPSEEHNLAELRPDVVEELTQRLAVLRTGVYDPHVGDKANPLAEQVWREVYHGFVGPWKDLNTQVFA